ncbi:MAG: hypothetical protein A4E19_04450 [Nitrospira sp. SG-bin1]|nr:MAG: hypothetical protein A4E19_04450 [Nitrospira sp. SG-bin1]
MNGPACPRPEDLIVKAFVTYLAARLYPGLRIVEWPDKNNTRTTDIDAIAESGDKRVAIEHTSTDYLPNQRLHDERFLQAIGYLEQELKGQIHSHLRVITPFGAVPTGIRWDEIRDRLRRWILDNVPQLPADESKHNISIEGVPFPLTVQKLYRSLYLAAMVYFSHVVWRKNQISLSGSNRR